MAPDAPVATLIGDVVASRTVFDRAGLHDRLSRLVERGNAELRPLTPLRITVGDEYQGTFATVGAALHAALWLRLHFQEAADLRHGVGWGPVAVLAEEPRVEDGPGWWAAREAVDAARAEAERPVLRFARTSYRRAADVPGPDPAAVNAALLCRDQMVGSLTTKGGGRSMRLLVGMLEGRNQNDLARDEGISASAVSQRVRNDGLGALLAADEMLREVR
jgi:hypothetical protein